MNKAERTKKVIFVYWEKIPALTSTEDFEAMLEDLNHIADEIAVAKVKLLIWHQAKAVGVRFDSKTKKFVYGLTF